MPTELKTPIPATDRNSFRLGDDLIWGIKAIAAELDLPEDKVWYLVSSGLLPTRHLGRRRFALRSELWAALNFNSGTVR
jgi:hypothetical protein